MSRRLLRTSEWPAAKAHRRPHPSHIFDLPKAVIASPPADASWQSSAMAFAVFGSEVTPLAAGLALRCNQRKNGQFCKYCSECRRSAFAFATSFGRFIAAGVTFLVGAEVARMHAIGTAIAHTAVALLLGIALLPPAAETVGKELPV
jgi:hypothetical protein